MKRPGPSLLAALFIFFYTASFAQIQPSAAPRIVNKHSLLEADQRKAAILQRVGRFGPLRALLPKPRPAFAPGQYNVKFKPGVNGAAIAAVHKATGARMLSAIPQLGIQTIKATDAIANQYLKNPNVLWIEKNPMRYPLIVDPNEAAYNYIDYDMSFDGEWGTWRKWDSHVIQAVDAWSIWPNHYYTAAGGKGVDGVRVALIDTGIDEGHEDFKNAGGTLTDVTSGGGQLLLNLNRTIFNGVSSGGAMDVFGHGTHTGGISGAATNNAKGTIGNGINANVFMVRVTDSQGNGTASDLASAITYCADNGAVAINVSLGDYQFSYAEQNAVTYAWNKGSLVIAAAGNDGANTTNQPVYPAALTRVLAVSATTHDDFLTTYSNWGDAIGIGAPGGDYDLSNGTFSLVLVYSTMPQYSVTMNTDPNYAASMNYEYVAGTSMASPEVMGAAALYAGMKGIRTATPGAPALILQALQRGADDITGDTTWSPYYGWGRLNMYNTMLDYPLSSPPPRGDPFTGPLGGLVGQVQVSGTVVLNANVVATRQGTGQQFSSSTRFDGGYRLPNVPTGLYNITATYTGQSQTISNVQVYDGCDTPAVDFNIGATTNSIPLQSITLSPTTVAGTKTSTGTATLTQAATGSGVIITLSSSNTGVANPAVTSITIPAGSTSKTFTVNTFAVGVSTNVTISGSSPDGTTKSATLTVRPPNLLSLSLSPSTVAGTLNSTGTVTLEAAAPASGMTVAVSSNNTAIANPTVSSVTIASGATKGTFTITTASVTSSQTATISASLNGITKNATLTVRPPVIKWISASPNPVAGSKVTTGTAQIEAPAPTGGTLVTLTSANTAYATVPASVTVPAGLKQTTFPINTVAVSSTQPVTITGTTGSASKSFVLNVRPIGVLSVTLNPLSVTGGNPSQGTVTLEAPAAPGGITVTLSSSNTTYATVPASIVIPAGSTTGAFTVTTFHPAAQVTAIITATANGISKTKTLTIKP